jgi:hypothetical protein
MAKDEQGLEHKIAHLTRLLHHLQQHYSSLTDPQVIALSQELDGLILEWHRREHRPNSDARPSKPHAR